jgi:hypothetical protein
MRFDAIPNVVTKQPIISTARSHVALATLSSETVNRLTVLRHQQRIKTKSTHVVPSYN